MKPPRPAIDKRLSIDEQDAWGNSIANLRRNLKMSPVERIRQADEMLRFASRFKGIADARKRP